MIIQNLKIIIQKIPNIFLFQEARSAEYNTQQLLHGCCVGATRHEATEQA